MAMVLDEIHQFYFECLTMSKLLCCRLVSIFLCVFHFCLCDESKDFCTEGQKQSPINICSSQAEEVELPGLIFRNHWNPDLNLCMFQGGNTVIIRPNDEADPTSIECGPLEGTFVLDQLHFHWGTDNNNGTEHSLDDCKYAMEAHLVYFNCMFGCAQRAIGRRNGLAIIAVLIESKPTFYNCEFDNIAACLYRLNCPGVSIPLTHNVINVFKDVLLSKEYFAYDGSLTTPPCCEEVTWLVFKRVVCVHCTQVYPFRQIVNAEGKPICSNIREIQPLNGRVICDVTSSCPCCPDDEEAKKRKMFLP